MNGGFSDRYYEIEDLKESTKSDDEIADLDLEFSNFNKEFNSFDSIPLYMIGGFIVDL